MVIVNVWINLDDQHHRQMMYESISSTKKVFGSPCGGKKTIAITEFRCRDYQGRDFLSCDFRSRNCQSKLLLYYVFQWFDFLNSNLYVVYLQGVPEYWWSKAYWILAVVKPRLSQSSYGGDFENLYNVARCLTSHIYFSPVSFKAGLYSLIAEQSLSRWEKTLHKLRLPSLAEILLSHLNEPSCYMYVHFSRVRRFFFNIWFGYTYSCEILPKT